MSSSFNSRPPPDLFLSSPLFYFHKKERRGSREVTSAMTVPRCDIYRKTLIGTFWCLRRYLPRSRSMDWECRTVTLLKSVRSQRESWCAAPAVIVFSPLPNASVGLKARCFATRARLSVRRFVSRMANWWGVELIARSQSSLTRQNPGLMTPEDFASRHSGEPVLAFLAPERVFRHRLAAGDAR